MVVHLLVFSGCLILAIAASSVTYMSGMQSSGRIIQFIDGQDRASQMTLSLNQDIQMRGGINMLITNVQAKDPTATTSAQYEAAILPDINDAISSRGITVKKLHFFKMHENGNTRTYTELSGKMTLSDFDMATAECVSSGASLISLNFTVVLPR
ncbi:MAG: hypothetical protein J7501_06880 [Bdellovibrio sp.]|nr:hypothetical protein [Bdellovibrio sp.]